MAITVQPLAEAVAHHGAKTPVGSVLRTREWARMPRELRQRAQFSAGVESARYLQRVQDGIGKVLAQERTWGRDKVLRDLMEIAEREGLRPTGRDRGGLLDPGSERRTELIYSMQTQQAYGHAEWRAGQDPDALDAAPAQELIRVEDRKAPRDWVRRWIEAGGRLYAGRMIALKTDPIWERISRFGTPWPPFDFQSGMGLEDVLRSEAEQLGLMATGTPPPAPVEAEFNARVEAEVGGLGTELRMALQSLFGPQIDVAGQKVQWNVGRAAEYESDRANIRESARRVFAGSEAALGQLGRGVQLPEAAGDTLAFIAREASVQISAVAVGRKPLYHEDWGVADQASLARAATGLQGVLPQGVRAVARDGHLYVWHPSVARLADPKQQLLPQVIAHADDGRWLGYGTNFPAERTWGAWVINEAGEQLSGFRVPTRHAELYAAARARDWVDATGRPHTYEIVRP